MKPTRMKPMSDELLSRLAARYALGTMLGGARRRFERMLESSERVKVSVARWQEYVAALSSSVPPMQPSAALWQRIERRTIERDLRAASWLRRLWPGMGAAFAAGALTLLLAVQVAPPVFIDAERAAAVTGRLPESYAGLLTDMRGPPAMLVSSARPGRRRFVKVLAELDLPQDAVLRLWALPKEGAPFELGVVPAQGKGELTMSESSETLLSKVPELAVSMELAGSSESSSRGFLLRGHCVKLW